MSLLCIYRFPFVAVSIAFAVNKEVRQIKQDRVVRSINIDSADSICER